MEHRQVLVADRLVRGKSPVASLPALVRQLRRLSDLAQLSGGLLFDGECVVMLFEGAAAEVARLLDVVAAAPQLDGSSTLLVDRMLVSEELMRTRWIAGYAEPELINTLREDNPDPAAVAQAFKQALGDSDAL